MRVISPHVLLVAIEGRLGRLVGFELDTTAIAVMKVFLIILTSCKTNLTNLNFVGDIATAQRRLRVGFSMITTSPSTLLVLICILRAKAF